jgi:hypothetical protein
MSIQYSARQGATRPIAAGVLIVLAAPLLGLFPGLALYAIGLVPREAVAFGSGAQGTISMAYILNGIQSVVAGLLAGLAIWKQGSVSPQHWRAVSAILALAWITLVGIYVKFQPPSLLLIVILYLGASAMFASWVLRIMIVKLRWMRLTASERAKRDWQPRRDRQPN